jgi:hypothetical protein
MILLWGKYSIGRKFQLKILIKDFLRNLTKQQTKELAIIFRGMMTAIIVLDSLSHTTFSVSKYIMPIGIPLFFIALSCFQMVKVYKKYIR